MKCGVVYYKEDIAGIIAKFRDGSYEFRYLKSYRESDKSYSISATLPKSKAMHTSKLLFPFFYGLLSEGVQKDNQCRALRIDEDDHFGRLLETCKNDCAGAVRVERRKKR